MRRLLASALTIALLALPVTASAVTLPVPLPVPVPSPPPAPATVFTQTTADPPIAVPATAACTEQVVVHDFQNSYYAPGIGQHVPPAACPGPWSKVVLTLTGSVGGVQFDRLVDVFVGDVPALSSSTSEPCCIPGAVTQWTVRKDVSQLAGLLATPQTITVYLNNVWIAGQYTGIYHVTVSLTFYRTGAGAPAISHPDVVAPVTDPANSGADGYFSLGAAGQLGSASVTLPRNLLRLQADLYAQGHGPCEEFWWASPNQCGAGTPYREAQVFVDGALAGAAPVYPVVFTGGDGPGLWEPIPSPRAWDLRPSRVDLTPFVGRLVDGLPHTVAVGVQGATYAGGDYWLVGANLLGWTDHGSSQTSGALTAVSAPASPTETGGWDPSGNLVYQFDARHPLSWSGWVSGSAGRVTTSVSEGVHETTVDPGISTSSTWHWWESSATAAGSSLAVSDFSILNSSPASFQFEDAGSTSVQGANPSWSNFDEKLLTAGPGLAMNGFERESYRAQSSAGLCYDRTLTAAVGLIIDDRSDAACKPSSLPIALPLPLALPLSAAGASLRPSRAAR
jgi:hypothetical protein